MEIKSIFNISIDRQTQAVAEKSFNIPLILGNNTKLATGATYFSDIKAVDSVLNSGEIEFDMANKLFSQDKPPEKIIIGKKEPGDSIAVALGKIQNLTSGPNDFYAIHLFSDTKADILAAAAWTESNKKLLVVRTKDSNVITNATDDVATALKAANYSRTAIIYTSHTNNYVDAGWVGDVIAADPGTLTWKFKQLNGVTVDNLDSTAITNLENKNCNAYNLVGGQAITLEGIVSTGEFIDTIHSVDKLESQLQTDVMTLAVQKKKIPFTNAGFAMIASLIDSRLKSKVKSGMLDNSEGRQYSITIPKVQDLSLADRAARKFTGIKFKGFLAGAVHKGEINGTVTV